MPLDTDIYNKNVIYKKNNNLIDKLKVDIATEIARAEENLKALKNFQAVIDSPRQKRKYKKKKAISADSAPRDEAQAANTKKKPGRARRSPVLGIKMP